MKLPLVGRTRCHQCWVQLKYTDDDDPDEVIAKHIRKNCKFKS